MHTSARSIKKNKNANKKYPKVYQIGNVSFCLWLYGKINVSVKKKPYQK